MTELEPGELLSGGQPGPPCVEGTDLVTLSFEVTGFPVGGAMWRPVEVLLYDWWPIVTRRRLLRRVTSAEVFIRHRAASVMPMVPLCESR